VLDHGPGTYIRTSRRRGGARNFQMGGLIFIWGANYVGLTKWEGELKEK
jgi:hypothetical protein